MGLYNDWTNYVVEFVKQNGEPAFWKEYAEVEKNIYSKVLANHSGEIKGNIAQLAPEFGVTEEQFMGFLDGVNESLENELNLETIERETGIELKINFEKLYFNMLDSKADYLYNLPQWDGIFSVEKRKDIQREWRGSKTVVNENKVGRNEPCPCGSGKKFKKCCG
jgi:preprotein translocase subunit SecA